MASRWKHDIKQNCIFCISNIHVSQCNVDIQKSASTHAAFFSENLKFSTVDSILTKIMVYFEDKINRKKKTAALLLCTQLEHDQIILQEQHHLRSYRYLVYYYVVFQAALCFLSSRAVPAAVFDGRNDPGRNDPGRNDSRAKRLRGETTHGRNDPGPYKNVDEDLNYRLFKHKFKLEPYLINTTLPAKHLRYLISFSTF